MLYWKGCENIGIQYTAISYIIWYKLYKRLFNNILSKLQMHIFFDPAILLWEFIYSYACHVLSDKYTSIFLIGLFEIKRLEAAYISILGHWLSKLCTCMAWDSMQPFKEWSCSICTDFGQFPIYNVKRVKGRILCIVQVFVVVCFTLVCFYMHWTSVKWSRYLQGMKVGN